MTKKQKELCEIYSAFDAEGKTHCYECPLVIDLQSRQCIATLEQTMNGGNPSVSVFDKEEIIENCTVQILSNSTTGEVSIGWWKN